MNKGEINLLDHFAGLAMQAIYAQVGKERNNVEIACEAYDVAQAMLDERERMEIK